MSVKIGDIEGVVIDKNKHFLYEETQDGWKQAIDQISNVRLELDVYKVAKILWDGKIKTKYIKDGKKNFRTVTFRECSNYAQAINAALPSLLRVVKDKT